MTNVITRKNVPFGLSLSKELMRSIDEERGDISRSKFVSRLLENNFEKLATIKDEPFHKNSVPVDLGLDIEDQEAVTLEEKNGLIGQDSSPKANSDPTTQEHKICVGKSCNNIATNELKILYINKTAWFCDSCKKDLFDLKLVLTEDDGISCTKIAKEVGE